MNNILIVDDEEENLVLLQDILEENGFTVRLAHDGVEALAILDAAADEINTVLLDRIMPNMDGMETLSRIKNNPRFKDIPVIFQSSMARNEEILEGLQAGAFYYLTKPYPEEEILVALIRSAVVDHQNLCKIKNAHRKVESLLALTQHLKLSLRTLHEADSVAFTLGNIFPESLEITTCLLELLYNAIEHGNLGISYDEKTQLNNNGTWDEEVARRLSLDAYAHKRVKLQFSRLPTHVVVDIEDEGLGFDWTPYLKLTPARAFDNHGRGIAIANMAASLDITYLGRGNHVRVDIPLEERN